MGVQLLLLAIVRGSTFRLRCDACQVAEEEAEAEAEAATLEVSFATHCRYFISVRHQVQVSMSHHVAVAVAAGRVQHLCSASENVASWQGCVTEAQEVNTC